MKKTALIRQLLPRVREGVLLAPYTTFRIGGAAQYFFTAKTAQDMERAIRVAKRARLPYFLLAGGSNVVMADKGFKGLIIHVKTKEYTIRGTRVVAEAGVSMDMLVRETAKRGLAGLEWAGGLPGTLGGAVRGNAGAFGGEIKDSVVSVKAIDEKGRVRTFSKTQCRFSYRSSIFKEKKYIVLSAALGLKKGNAKELSKIAKSHMRYRRERHPLEYPNAGSVFKNCDVKRVSARWQKHFASVIKVDPFPVIPTAALIAEAKLKGLRVGNVQVSRKHPNYMVNLGNGKAKDVKKLVEKVKNRVKNKFNVQLEEEIQFA